MDLELTGKSLPARRIAITQLACPVNGAWQTVGWQWAAPVADSAAERMALLGTKPAVKAIATKADTKALESAVRAAFASKTALVDARSERPDAFNFGSGPNERSVGGSKIKSVFGSLRADIKLLPDGRYHLAVGSTAARVRYRARLRRDPLLSTSASMATRREDRSYRPAPPVASRWSCRCGRSRPRPDRGSCATPRRCRCSRARSSPSRPCSARSPTRRRSATGSRRRLRA